VAETAAIPPASAVAGLASLGHEFMSDGIHEIRPSAERRKVDWIGHLPRTGWVHEFMRRNFPGRAPSPARERPSQVWTLSVRRRGGARFDGECQAGVAWPPLRGVCSEILTVP
jgi:hypothetical protein